MIKLPCCRVVNTAAPQKQIDCKNVSCCRKESKEGGSSGWGGREVSSCGEKMKERSCFQHSCYCSLFWLSEDLTEPWPRCLQHEEVVRQTHNKKWCSWVLRSPGCSLRVCCWHGTSGHRRGSPASQAPPRGRLSAVRPSCSCVELNRTSPPRKGPVTSFSAGEPCSHGKKIDPNAINATFCSDRVGAPCCQPPCS